MGRFSLAHLAKTVLHGVWHHLGALIYPPRCMACPEPVEQHGGLCPSCWPQVRFIHGAMCASCGLPFPNPMPAGALCLQCLQLPPAATLQRSACVYDGALRHLVHRFKYNDAMHITPQLAQWMQRAGAEVLAGADLLVPVPLHWRRLLWRRYNQSALLSEALSKATRIPHAPNAMRRTRYTRPQAALPRAKRLGNVKGVFAVRARARPLLAGKCVVLIDDVHTTGATLEACSKALLAAGAREVRCLTIARTLAS